MRLALPKPVRAGAEIADDVGFISRLIDHLSAENIVDRNRLYVAGFSRGALMTFEMLCRQADTFAAAGRHGGDDDGSAAGRLQARARRPDCRAFAGTADRSMPLRRLGVSQWPPAVDSGDDGFLAAAARLHGTKRQVLAGKRARRKARSG